MESVDLYYDRPLSLAPRCSCCLYYDRPLSLAPRCSCCRRLSLAPRLLPQTVP